MIETILWTLFWLWFVCMFIDLAGAIADGSAKRKNAEKPEPKPVECWRVKQKDTNL